MSKNQFQVLSEPGVSQTQVQGEARLIDPRGTRLQKIQATKRDEDRGNLLNEGVSKIIVPPYFDELAFFKHSLSVSPTDILESQSFGNFALGIGAIDDALYYNDANEVACTNIICKKGLVVQSRDGWCGDRAIGP